MLMNTAAVMGYLERRLSAFIQDRLGPNRVGPLGLFQPFADLVKWLFKEEFIPGGANRFMFFMAPLFVMVPSFVTFAVIPFGNISWGEPITAISGLAGAKGSLAIADVGMGILFFIAVSSLAGYGLAYGGWASFNKYSLFGGLRSAAQLVSFEIAMGLALISVLMTTGHVNLNEIVISQKGYLWGYIPNWLCFKQPLIFVIFIITAFAETNRLPFDMAEAEPELVGGFHTEYSSMKWALFFMGEYVAMAGISAVIVTLFLGGWHFPGVESLFAGSSAVTIGIVSSGIFMAKMGALLFLFIWVRWSLPRVRWDQLMKLGWKVLIPLTIINIIVTALSRIF